MPNITNCLRCCGLYEESSSEYVNDPNRLCPACYRSGSGRQTREPELATLRADLAALNESRNADAVAYDCMRAQRDELLAACEAICAIEPAIEDMSEYMQGRDQGIAEAQFYARAAIAKAKG